MEVLKKFYLCFKNSKLSFIMTIISCFIFVIFLLTTFTYDMSYRWIILSLSIIPFFVFLMITLLTNKFIHKKDTKQISTVFSTILSLLLIIYVLILLFVSALLEANNPIKNIKYYSYYYDNSKINSVFPETIPDDVVNIQFQYSPAVLQGGFEYSLYYIDENIEIDTFDNKYRKKAEWIGYLDEYNLKEGLLGGAFHFTPIDYENEDDFLIYLIDSECDDSGYCNHGEFLLVALNTKTKEIVYRFSNW